jgi:hypothetical protein
MAYDQLLHDVCYGMLWAQAAVHSWKPAAPRTPPRAFDTAVDLLICIRCNSIALNDCCRLVSRLVLLQVIDTCHAVGISKKCVRLRPVIVVKG